MKNLNLYRVKLKWTVLFIFSYLLSLIINIPAAIIIEQLPFPKSLNIYNAQGTLWEGSIDEIHWKNEIIHDIHWKVIWSQLFLGKPTITLTMHDSEKLTGHADISWHNDIYINNLKLSTPAAVLSPYLTTALPLETQGNVELSIHYMQFNTNSCASLNGYMTWKPATLKVATTNIELNETITTLACKDNKFEIQIKQSADSINTQGTASLDFNGNYELGMTLNAAPNSPEEIRTILPMIGRDMGNNIYKINANGHL